MTSSMQSGQESKNLVPVTRPSRCSCMNFTKIIFGALPSIIFGIFTIFFTLQQSIVAQKNREQDQRQADERNIQSTFEHYISDISDRILDRKFNRSHPDHIFHIRVKTLTALRHVDATRKRAIILFLYESRLLRSDLPDEQRLYLESADLSDVQFTGTLSFPLNLTALFLPGIIGSNIVFQHCILDRAIFNGSIIPNFKVVDSTIFNTSFRGIYAPDITMADLILYGNDFTDSIMPGVRIQGSVSPFAGVDLSNSNMFDEVKGPRYDSLNRTILSSSSLKTVNARFPDGSFGPIDTSNLIINGDAEENCSLSNMTQSWLNSFEYSMSVFLVKNISRLSQDRNLGNCTFVAQHQGRSIIKQQITMNRFSALIDSGQAGYSISFYMGCFHQGTSNISAAINFFKKNYIWADYELISITDQQPKYFYPKMINIPIGTRIIELMFVSSINHAGELCILDQIQMNLFHNPILTSK